MARLVGNKGSEFIFNLARMSNVIVHGNASVSL